MLFSPQKIIKSGSKSIAHFPVIKAPISFKCTRSRNKFVHRTFSNRILHSTHNSVKTPPKIEDNLQLVKQVAVKMRKMRDVRTAPNSTYSVSPKCMKALTINFTAKIPSACIKEKKILKREFPRPRHFIGDEFWSLIKRDKAALLSVIYHRNI